jgi:hypothetical protein
MLKENVCLHCFTGRRKTPEGFEDVKNHIHKLVKIESRNS